MTMWTHERIDELRRLTYTEHLSTSQAARSLSEKIHQPVTKNMVISKCHREGIKLTNRRMLTPAQVQEIRESTETAVALARRFGVWPETVGRARRGDTYRAIPSAIAFPEHGHCIWPHGDPGSPGFHFCGGYLLPGKPYCSAHAAVAYVRPTDKAPA